MSRPGQQRAAVRAWAQLAAAVAAVLLIGVTFYGGLIALAALAVAWPPAVKWRPVAALSVLRVYVPFAVVWLAFVAGYLQAMHAAGHTVAPQPMLQQLADHGTELDRWYLTVLGIVAVAPLGEELVFRGYLFTALATALPMWATQLVTAVLFGLVHGVDYALPIGVLALLFGWLRQRYESLAPPLLAHAVHNGITVLLTLLWPAHLDLLYPR